MIMNWAPDFQTAPDTWSSYSCLINAGMMTAYTGILLMGRIPFTVSVRTLCRNAESLLMTMTPWKSFLFYLDNYKPFADTQLCSLPMQAQDPGAGRNDRPLTKTTPGTPPKHRPRHIPRNIYPLPFYVYILTKFTRFITHNFLYDNTIATLNTHFLK